MGLDGVIVKADTAQIPRSAHENALQPPSHLRQNSAGMPMPASSAVSDC